MLISFVMFIDAEQSRFWIRAKKLMLGQRNMIMQFFFWAHFLPVEHKSCNRVGAPYLPPPHLKSIWRFFVKLVLLRKLSLCQLVYLSVSQFTSIQRCKALPVLFDFCPSVCLSAHFCARFVHLAQPVLYVCLSPKSWHQKDFAPSTHPPK